jgi:DnaJ-domain-containing protein 1
VSDYFALLNEPRRLWLDADALKQTFLTRSAAVHPDKIHSASDAEKAAAAKSFADLNTAFATLAEPKTRLQHLLELELGAKPQDIQQVPPQLAELVAEVITAYKSADAFIAEKARATSPLVQVQLFERGQEWVEELQALQAKLNGLREQLTARLKTLDERWMNAHHAGRRAMLPAIEELFRLFSYFNRWHSQIQERVVQLSF